mgnify:FL=1
MSIENKFPPIDMLVYDKIHDFVNYKSSDYNYSNHEKKVLEQKLIYIINALSILIYKTTIFSFKFSARKEGPVEISIEKIQNGIKKVTEKTTYSEKELSIFKIMSNNIINTTIDAINDKIIEFNPKYLSKLTHDKAWKKRRYNDKKNCETGARENKNYNSHNMKPEDIKSFAINTLPKKCPEFIAYVINKIDNM